MHKTQVIEKIYGLIGHEVLKQAEQKDDFVNWTQVEGKDEIKRIAVGVSLNATFLEKAIEWGADACIFHHGLDLRNYKSRMPLYTQKRLQLIFANELTIMAFHHALDTHQELGNSSVIAQKLGLTVKEPLFDMWAYIAEAEQPIPVSELKTTCAELFQHEIFEVSAPTDTVTRIGIASGAAIPSVEMFEELVNKGVELLITGETTEHIPHMFKDAGIGMLAGGHYATEVFGVKALGEKLQEELKDEVEVQFIDVWNAV